MGGGWTKDRVRVTGPEAGYSTYQLSYREVVVDTDIDEAYFFDPDCVVYRTNRANGASYVACGDRLPVRLPFSLYSVDDRGVWGGNRINDARQEERQMLPVRDVLDAAAAQPARNKNFRWELNAAPLTIEPQWVR